MGMDILFFIILPVVGGFFWNRKYTILPWMFSQGGHLLAGIWHLMDICQEWRSQTGAFHALFLHLWWAALEEEVIIKMHYIEWNDKV